MNAIPSVAKIFDLTDRTVIVTGASGGIGAGIARRLGEAGAQVVCHFRSNRQAANDVVGAITDAGGRATALEADLSTNTGAEALLRKAVEAYGAVDGLVNNAGLQTVQPLAQMSGEEWSAMMATNTSGPFLLCRALAEHVRERGASGAAVVNIASIEGHQPAPGHAHYAASKAALLMLTKAAAIEFGDLGIRVNAVSPGLIHRDGIEEGWPDGVGRWKRAAPLKRLGQPEDIGDAVLFLLSAAARWITGADLIVDGGVSARPTW